MERIEEGKGVDKKEWWALLHRESFVFETGHWAMHDLTLAVACVKR